jgi:hypothetical protein
MNKKDIALTVGGVLATMVLAYLLYSLQQRDAATAAANSANAEADAEDQQAEQEEYLSQLPTASTGVASGTTTLDTSNEGSTDTTSSSGTDGDAATESLLTNIIADFAGSINQGTPGATQNASLIPTLPNTQLSLVNVPTTPGGLLNSTTSAGSSPVTTSSPQPILSVSTGTNQ